MIWRYRRNSIWRPHYINTVKHEREKRCLTLTYHLGIHKFCKGNPINALLNKYPHKIGHKTFIRTGHITFIKIGQTLITILSEKLTMP